MKKQTFILDEAKLNNIIKNSVKKVLNEGSFNGADFDPVGHKEQLEERYKKALNEFSKSISNFEIAISNYRNEAVDDYEFVSKMSDILNITREFTTKLFRA